MKDRVVIGNHFLARPLSRSGEADLLSASDRLDILDLLHTVGWCIDSRAYEVLSTIITEDFVLDHASGMVEGRDEFIAFLTHEKYFEGLRHQNANPLLRSVDLSNSIAVSYLILTRVEAGNAGARSGQARTGEARGGASASALQLGPEIMAHGVCTDLLKKDKEIWKLSKRTIDQMIVSAAFISDAASRERLAMTAKDHRATQSKQRTAGGAD